MTKNPRDILDQFVQAVNNADADAILSLYDPEALLIPTFSNRVLNSPDKLRDYFETLGSRPELSIALREKTLVIQDMGNQVYVLGGIYSWRFVVEEELLNFEARFSYVMDLSRPNPIVHHHSSQIPRML